VDDHEAVDETAGQVSRRRLLAGTAAAVAGAGALGSLAGEAAAHGARAPVPAPNPIPGGLPIGLPPPLDFIHFFAPGPEGRTLPFSGSVLQGLDVEPSTITDFRGTAAQAYLIGRADGSDGQVYGMEVDIRAYRGRYVTAAGEDERAAFVFI
jgi:hypothetical protein